MSIFNKIKPSEEIKKFIDIIIQHKNPNLHSIYLTGSFISSDYNEKTSDINSLIVLDKVDISFLDFVSHLGKKFKDKKISVPLVLSVDYIKTSTDVFPIEFLDLKFIHKLIYGENIISNIQVSKEKLRDQCENNIKSRLILFRQGYVSAVHKKEILVNLFSKVITGCMPLFRAVVYLVKEKSVIKKTEVIKELCDICQLQTSTFESMFKIKEKRLDLSNQELNTIFKDFYDVLEVISNFVDKIKIK